jgi:hypothetical protein
MKESDKTRRRAESSSACFLNQRQPSSPIRLVGDVRHQSERRYIFINFTNMLQSTKRPSSVRLEASIPSLKFIPRVGPNDQPKNHSFDYAYTSSTQRRAPCLRHVLGAVRKRTTPTRPSHSRTRRCTPCTTHASHTTGSGG